MTTGEILMILVGAAEAIGTVAAAIIMIVALKRVTDIKITNQPLTVQVMEHINDRFAGKTDFNAHVAKTEQSIEGLREMFRVEIPEMERRLNENGEKRIRRVHSRIDPLSQGIAALCSRQGIRAPKVPDDEADTY